MSAKYGLRFNPDLGVYVLKYLHTKVETVINFEQVRSRLNEELLIIFQLAKENPQNEYGI